MEFQYGYVFTVWSSNFGKITFWSLFWKIVVLVPKLRRLNQQQPGNYLDHTLLKKFPSSFSYIRYPSSLRIIANNLQDAFIFFLRNNNMAFSPRFFTLQLTFLIAAIWSLKSPGSWNPNNSNTIELR